MTTPEAATTLSNLIRLIGDDPVREGLVETPLRVLRAYEELFSGYKQDPSELFKTFESDGYDEMILVKGITYLSFCEHHLMPVEGIAAVAYIPNGRVAGLSKLARLVDIYARRLQLQERMTVQITSAIEKHLRPKGVACILEAKHGCLSCRGARQENASMITSSLTGAFKDDTNTRQEFLKLLKG